MNIAISVVKLKEILNANNYPSKGKRSELINLIVDNESSMKMYLPKMYITSNKGESYIDGYQDLIMLRGNPYHISFEEHMEVKKGSPSYLKFSDLIWQVFQKRDLDGLYSKRSTTLDRAMFLRQEKKNR